MDTNLPKTMRAAQGSSFGDVMEKCLWSKMVTWSPESSRVDDPYVPTEPAHPLVKTATKKDRQTHMILKTLAVALAPGDCRVLSGKTRYLQGPPSFPYIPGGDVCGIFVDTMPNETYSQKGDVVTARFTVAPRDAIAEYARVSTTVCDKVPEGVSPVDAAALASASPSVIVADLIHPNDRVLIVGAGGGIGSHVCQLASSRASYVCGISRSPDRLLKEPLSCDEAIDYTKEDVLESTKFHKEPFDTIIDLWASGMWLRLVENAKKTNSLPSIIKPASQGGRYITTTLDKPTFETENLGKLLMLLLLQPLWRSM